jgi:hypothetical protein
MALLIRPPPTKTLSKKSYYTLHTTHNTIYATIPPHEDTLCSVVAFTNESNCILMGKMLEEYKRQMGEWPPLDSNDVMMLPVNEKNGLNDIIIQKWEKDELDLFCLHHMFDIVVLYSMKQTVRGYEVSGNLYHIRGNDDFYRELFENLIT